MAKSAKGKINYAQWRKPVEHAGVREARSRERNKIARRKGACRGEKGAADELRSQKTTVAWRRSPEKRYFDRVKGKKRPAKKQRGGT